MTNLLKSFRIRIAVFTTIGLCVLLGVWSVSIYRILLNSRMNELEAELQIQAIRAEPTVFFLRRQATGDFRFPDYPEAAPAVSDDLLVALNRDNSVLYANDSLNGEDRKRLVRVLRTLPRPAPPPTGNSPQVIFPSPAPPPGVHEPPGQPGPPVPPGFSTMNERIHDEMETAPQGPRNVVLSGAGWRIIPVVRRGERYVVGLPLAPVYDHARTALKAMFLLSPAMLALSLLITWLVVSRALVPIWRMTRLAGQIDIDSLNQRLASDLVPSEFKTLLDVFNEMLGRLEKSVLQAQRFSADAAHELKTPLTILRGQLEREIEREETGSPRQQRLTSLLDEVARLRRITERLLLLSYRDSGRLSLNNSVVDLRQLLGEIADDFSDSGVSFEWTPAEDAPVHLKADLDLLGKALQNLVENAVKYNRAGGRISIEVMDTEAVINLRFGNSGEAIEADMQPFIFDRFVRADNARERRIEGTGLGLSLAREILQLHEGDIKLVVSRDDWTEFYVTLPRKK